MASVETIEDRFAALERRLADLQAAVGCQHLAIVEAIEYLSRIQSSAVTSIYGNPEAQGFDEAMQVSSQMLDELMANSKRLIWKA